MMRVILAGFWGLVIFWLLATDAGAQPGRKAVIKARDTQKVRTGTLPIEVKGYGLTVDKAKADALEQARRELVKHLRGLEPPVRWWTPSVGFVQKYLLQGEGQPGPDVEVENVGPTKTWLLKVVPPDGATMQRLDRQAREEAEREERAGRMEERMGLAAKVMAALVALLALAYGYIRLDELTRGVYTRWLRLALVSILAAAGAGLWLLG